MSRLDRREAAARELLEGASPLVPPDVYADALARGRRMLRRRVAVRRLLWCVLGVAVVVFTVWALAARPWDQPPSDTTPPVTGW